MRRLGEDFAEQILRELETHVEGFEPTPAGEIIVHTRNRSLEADLVLIGIGVVPKVALASKAGLTLVPTGAIAVNDHMQTNVPFIYVPREIAASATNASAAAPCMLPFRHCL